MRLGKDMLMSDMAERLKVSPSYLSAVEFGRRPVPEGWPKNISRILNLNENESRLLADTAAAASSRSRGAVTVSLDELTPLQEEVAIEFARKIRELTEDELRKIKDHLLEGRSGEQNWRRGSR
jgi:transcriptional regulator with XRE-family HTH domain